MVRHTSEDVLEGELYVAGIQSRRLDERQVVLACCEESASVGIKVVSGGHYLLANALASSVGTALRCRKSLLLPTSMMTMFASAWSRNSLSHRVTFSYV